MAATFVVEDGTGLATANSYPSVAEADEHWENYGTVAERAAWSGSSTADKQDALREGTRYIDNRYQGRWRGVRGTTDQALDHPRIRVIDTDGWARDENIVFTEVKRATIMAALKVRLGVDLMPDVEGSDVGVSSESVTVGPISESKTYAGSKTAFKTYSSIEATLRPILQRSGRRERS